MHEAHVGVELVRRACSGGQICSGSSQDEISLADEALEVEDRRWVAAPRVRATRISRR